MRTRAPDSLLDRVRPIERDGVLTVDLRTLTWVPPSIMVATAAQAHRATAAGQQFAVLGPMRKDPADYAARMRLGRVLADFGADHDLPAVHENDQREHLIELAAIDSEQAADQLAELVYRKMYPSDAALARALHKSMGEIGENVPDHAAT